MEIELAIIIPTYKGLFFKQTLDSLVNQSNKNFNLYIGDDNSPDNIEQIVAEYTGKLNIIYHKFPNNIGGKKLVNQWNRCVHLMKNEKWIWLFSDDDLADFNCVETFFNTIDKDAEKYDVYRFNTRVINDSNVIIGEHESPFEENAYNMCIDILQLKRGHCMPDHIFRKSTYDELGGFVFTNYAQAADWATSINFATKKGICSMRNAKISWRYGSSNISGTADKNNHEKVLGHIQFIKWILKHFKNKINPIEYKNLQQQSYNNLVRLIKIHYKGIGLNTFIPVFKILLVNNKNVPKSFYDTLKLIKIKK